MTGKMETNVTKGRKKKRVSRLDERHNGLGVDLTNSGFRWGDELLARPATRHHTGRHRTMGHWDTGTFVAIFSGLQSVLQVSIR